MHETFFYEAGLQWNQGRLGALSSPQLPDIEVATPPEFPNGHPGVWSPEHLFVAAVSGCVMTTFLATADNSRLEFTAYQSNATGKLEHLENQYVISEITLAVTLTIAHEKDRARAERILRKAESACLITRSIRSSVVLKPTIAVATQ